MLMRMLFDEHPVPNDLAAAQAAPAGPELRCPTGRDCVQRFAQEAGVSITVVQDGAVQAVKFRGLPEDRARFARR